MAFKLADRVRETSTTTGTGSLALAGAAIGYQSFDTAFDDGDTTWYAIILGTSWEVGLGTFTAPATLARTSVIASSNGGSAVSFGAGEKDVFVTAPASALKWLSGITAAGHEVMTAADDTAQRAAMGARSLPRRVRTINSASSSGDRTLTVDDIGGLIIFSGTSDFTVSLSAAATLANGWSIAFRSVGKCVVTLDPNGSETIDGAATGKVLFKQSGEIICDGTELFTVGKQNRVLLDAQSFSGVSAVDFTSLAPGYRNLIFKGKSISLSVGAANINGRFSIDNGSNYRSASGDYYQHYRQGQGASFNNSYFNTGTSLQFLVGNAQVGFQNNFELRLFNPNDEIQRHQCDYSNGGSFDNSGAFFTALSHAELSGPSAARINAFRFLTSSGTCSGEIALYGEE